MNFYSNPYAMMPPAYNPMMMGRPIKTQQGYVRPEKTRTQALTDEEKQNMLQKYVPVEVIDVVPPMTHVRYESWAKDKKCYLFRMGGFLSSVGPEFVILSNGTNTWSVSKSIEGHPTRFYRILSKAEQAHVHTQRMTDEILMAQDAVAIQERTGDRITLEYIKRLNEASAQLDRAVALLIQHGIIQSAEEFSHSGIKAADVKKETIKSERPHVELVKAENTGPSVVALLERVEEPEKTTEDEKKPVRKSRTQKETDKEAKPKRAYKKKPKQTEEGTSATSME